MVDPRRDGGQRRAAVDPDRPRVQRREPAVGHQRLHARVRRLPAARRPRGRPVRPPPAVPRRRRDLLGRLAAQRPRDLARPGSSAPRALQGLGGALVSPAALSIITTTFAEGEDRTKALGVWSAIAAGGGAFGLLLGGILTDLLSWEWIFFVNVPIGIATAALAIRYVPESRAPNRPDSVDLPGAVTRHRGPRRARLRDRQGGGLRLGLARRRSACSPSRPRS